LAEAFVQGHARVPGRSRAGGTLRAWTRRPEAHPLFSASAACFILDESDKSRNPATDLFAAAAHLSARASARLCLSGTPYHNHPRDCLSQLQICHARPEFTRARAFGGRSCSAAFLGRLHASSLIRSREEMALPPLTERRVRLAMPLPEAARTDALLRGATDLVERFEASEAGFASVLRTFTSIRRLAAGCSSPCLEEDDSLQGPDSAKVTEAARLARLHAEAGRRVVVFCSFLEPLHRVRRALGEARSELYTGAMSRSERAAALARFRASEPPGALLATLSAGGVGLNLQEACVAVHMDKWWNPAATAQATGRIYRMGQQAPCFAEHLEYEDSFDDVCRRFFHEPKAQAAGTLLSGRYAPEAPLSLDSSGACNLLEEMTRRRGLGGLPERLAAVRRRMRAEGALRAAGAGEAEIAEARRRRQERAALRLAALRARRSQRDAEKEAKAREKDAKASARAEKRARSAEEERAARPAKRGRRAKETTQEAETRADAA
jgi:hypothetical protein